MVGECPIARPFKMDALAHLMTCESRIATTHVGFRSSCDRILADSISRWASAVSAQRPVPPPPDEEMTAIQYSLSEIIADILSLHLTDAYHRSCQPDSPRPHQISVSISASRLRHVPSHRPPAPTSAQVTGVYQCIHRPSARTSPGKPLLAGIRHATDQPEITAFCRPRHLPPRIRKSAEHFAWLSHVTTLFALPPGSLRPPCAMYSDLLNHPVAGMGRRVAMHFLTWVNGKAAGNRAPSHHQGNSGYSELRR